MGRPKVHPANRLRANTACTTCRASKKRCSGSFPCTNCINKGRARSCIPFKSISDPGLRSRRASAAQDPPNADTHGGDSDIRLESYLEAQINYSNLTAHGIRGPPPAGSRSPEATHRTHPRMLRNLQGERVYVGKAASLSFLQLLRDTVTQHIGPSQFSHNFTSEDMLETEAHHESLSLSDECCGIADKRRLINSFHVATSGFLYLGCDADELLAGPTEPKTDREKSRAAISDLMIAIGAQSCSKEPKTVHMERFFFTRGQRRTFANMLEDPSLDLVRAFLLMSFYMFGACRRNAAFMYLGVAARSAVALGLHEENSASLTSLERQERSRLWMSLCVIDLLASSILGRPAATAALLATNWQGLDREAATSSEVGLVASYQLSLVLEEIIDRLYSGKAASTETADMLLAKLSRWCDHLPELLRTPNSETDNPSEAQERIIGNLHVACSYHFAVILVTRPFLISTLSIRLARLHQTLSVSAAGSDLQENVAHSRLAAACTDSAVYMLQTCLEVHQHDLLLRNMGILKAFIFAAALVLGFSMFSHRDTDSEIDGAFAGALIVLRMLAQQSAQAAHYLEILTLLEGAIRQQRQRLAAQARQRRSQYVSRIFTLNEGSTRDRTQSDDDSRADCATPLLTQAGPYYQWNSQDDSITTAPPPVMDGEFVGWAGMELQLWDNFPFTDAGPSVFYESR